ncbi:MAG TPA: DUF6159 family protein [Acidimicrobiia bacterium]|nr:DUF6159 family protein [Acidimicrobiia bacterium]
MGRIQRSWELGKTSWRVLRTDRDLAAFPVFGAIASIVVLAVFAGLIFATGLNNGSGNNDSIKPIGWVFVVVLYIALAFVAVYFQAALTYGANERLMGRDTGIRACLDAANAKLHRLLPWALVAATVSIIIRSLEDRGIVGQIVASIVGTAWALVTFLTIPIIMLEDLGPGQALKRSGQLFKHTWGENVAAQFGFGIFGFIAAVPAIIVVAAVASADVLPLTIAVGAVAVAWLAVVSIVISAMTGIYKVALYHYAVDGKAPAAFADSDLAGAFAPKQQRRAIGGGFGGGGFGGGGFGGGGFAGPSSN